MADVGPLLARDSNDTGARGGLAPSLVVARSPYSLQAGNKFFTSAVNGSVSGVVQELSVNKAGCTVRVYDEATGCFLSSAVSDGSGAWSASALGRTKVYCIAFDSPYNSIVFDNVVPA